MTNHEEIKQSSEALQTGAALLGTALATLIIWPFMLGFFIFPSSETVYSRCLDATNGHLLHINRSIFPTQIYCETPDESYAGTIYSFWESAGLSLVIIVLVLAMFVGVWMMVRRNKRAPRS